MPVEQNFPPKTLLKEKRVDNIISTLDPGQSENFMRLKKGVLLLLVIYLAFICIGLPDSLLGAGWPAMYGDLGVSADFAGILSLIVAGGTIISSLLSARVIRYFGVAKVTAFSVLLTGLALMGYSYSHDFLYLCLLSLPLGLGAGSIDVALNNYVAVHYSALHMNWLHCFWGVGAAIGPLIMSRYLAMGKSWTNGYNTVAWLLILTTLILLASLLLWESKKREKEGKKGEKQSFGKLLRIPGVKSAMLVFFCYCTVEATFGLWGASFLVFVKDFTPELAAKLVAVYYGGITIGRFLSGLVTLKLSSKQMIYSGQAVILLGLLLLFLPFHFTLLPGFLLVGLGCAPIFPGLIHDTPVNFGEENAQAIIGIQMASAYTGISLMPLFFGKLSSFAGYGFLLWFLGIFLTLMILMNWRLNAVVGKKEVGYL